MRNSHMQHTPEAVTKQNGLEMQKLLQMNQRQGWQAGLF